MGVCRTTILTWRLEFGFLMYKRRRGPRWHWVTTDALIHSWELARCAADLKRDLAAHAAKRRDQMSRLTISPEQLNSTAQGSRNQRRPSTSKTAIASLPQATDGAAG